MLFSYQYGTVVGGVRAPQAHIELHARCYYVVILFYTFMVYI